MNPAPDTICAPATVPGTGAITIIRVSGPCALEYCDGVVSLRKGSLADVPAGTIRFGLIKDVDEVMAAVFRAPHSFTGEDSVEIYCHASPWIAGRVLEMLCAEGCRLAEPGEFTRRAFLAGKMDLSEAEAVADLIAASSESAHRLAFQQLRGEYSTTLKSLRNRLVEMSALLELELDFSEEDVEFADRSKLLGLLDEVIGEVRRLCGSFRTGNAIKEGVQVAIVGPVNAGKSTLLNALVGENRAIVSPIAGTTRDTIEESVTLGGIKFRFTDTAGLRDTSDLIEREGVSRSLSAASKADIVIMLSDATAVDSDLVDEQGRLTGELGRMDGTGVSRGFSDVSDATVESVGDFNPEPWQAVLHVLNKADLLAPGREPVSIPSPAWGPVPAENSEAADSPAFEHSTRTTDRPDATGFTPGRTSGSIMVSALTGEGLDYLRSELVRLQQARISECGSTLVTSLRHYEALRAALSPLQRIRTALSGETRQASTDLLAEDLRTAISHLNSIFGEISSDEVLGEIFGRFCIGK
ncbi:MAG: tRNA uridine-5-carboxymethylaminomethyl(34) synthesis GTPase MnmE [Bacteroidales bacterium]|nr:tRNA uridine-5-carboxymethylaminomethyl(34) synthesis GTPase MnmE [Bacteroidales bacterium]